MSIEAQIQAIIEKHLDLDTVHIEYHRESYDMVGRMAREIVDGLELRFEYQVGNNRLDRYDKLRDALDRAEYLNGPHLEELKRFAEMEEAEEARTGVVTSNTYRYAYMKALEERPVKVMMRQVTPWRRP